MANGRPVYVKSVSQTDVTDGWRKNRVGGGVVVQAKQIVCRGFLMPPSPRIQDDVLWLLISGSGEISAVDRTNGRFEPVVF
jgi:uncharacterized protein (TIGR03032 family)